MLKLKTFAAVSGIASFILAGTSTAKAEVISAQLFLDLSKAESFGTPPSLLGWDLNVSKAVVVDGVDACNDGQNLAEGHVVGPLGSIRNPHKNDDVISKDKLVSQRRYIQRQYNNYRKMIVAAYFRGFRYLEGNDTVGCPIDGGSAKPTAYNNYFGVNYLGATHFGANYSGGSARNRPTTSVEGAAYFGPKPTVSSVPELSTWAMMLFGFAGLGFAGYRASRKSAALAA